MADPNGQSSVPIIRLKMRLAIMSFPGPPNIMGGKYVPAVKTKTRIIYRVYFYELAVCFIKENISGECFV